MTLAFVAAEGDPQLCVDAVFDAPCADVVGDCAAVCGVDAGLFDLVAVGGVEEDAGEAVAEGYGFG